MNQPGTNLLNAVPWIRNRPLYPVPAPGGTFPGNPQNQFNNFLRQRRPSHVFPLPRVISIDS
jgi:hypothetical protein